LLKYYSKVGLDAIVVGDALPCPLESHCQRRNVKYVGVAPENKINLKE
jgi:hypothetical protein